LPPLAPSCAGRRFRVRKAGPHLTCIKVQVVRFGDAVPIAQEVSRHVGRIGSNAITETGSRVAPAHRVSRRTGRSHRSRTERSRQRGSGLPTRHEITPRRDEKPAENQRGGRPSMVRQIPRQETNRDRTLLRGVILVRGCQLQGELLLRRCRSPGAQRS